MGILNLYKNSLLGLVFGFFQNAIADCPAQANIKPNRRIGASLCGINPIEEECYKNFTWNLEVGFLWEQARLTGTQIAYSVPNSSYTLGGETVVACVVRPNFDLDWGITVGLGWFFNNDDSWYVGTKFDWLESEVSKNKDSDFYFVPINVAAPVGVFNILIDEIDMHMKINYYMLDVMLYCGSYLSRCFSINPHIGIRTAWFHYRESNIYIFSLGRGLQNIRTNSWGAGPEFGVDMEWHLYPGISFYGENGLALLFGQSGTRSRLAFQPAGGPEIEQNQGKENQDVAIPSIRASLGFKFSTCFSANKHNIYIKVLFDSCFYLNQFAHINANNKTVISPIGTPAADLDFVASDNNTFSLIGLKVVCGWVL